MKLLSGGVGVGWEGGGGGIFGNWSPIPDAKIPYAISEF